MLISGGCAYNSIPDVTSVRYQLEENRSDIDTTIGYLVDSGYSNIYIQSPTGIMVADLEDVCILDPTVSDAINRILENYIMINKVGNTIYLLQWRSSQDIGCGIAYTINGTSKPNVQFTTELIPISDDGWYYFVSDYNKWRTEHKE